MSAADGGKDSALVGARIGGCVVERRVGRGGMGDVYLARQNMVNRPVAVKLLSAKHSSDEMYRDRFLLEVRAAAAVEHPNIVPIYDAGETDGRLYLVMQYLKGGDLASHAAGRALPAAEVAAVGLHIAQALGAMWAEGIVHLDIKPANVLRSDPKLWKVGDFGIARVTSAASGGGRPGEKTMVAGTPPYMAHEQWSGRGVDGRTDLYALGVVLFELLTGRYPYDLAASAGPEAWFGALSLGEPARVASLAPATPPDLADLIGRLLAAKQADRPASAAAVADELGDLAARLRGRSTTAARPVLAEPEPAQAAPALAPSAALPVTLAIAPPAPIPAEPAPAARVPSKPGAAVDPAVGRCIAALAGARAGRGCVILIRRPADQRSAGFAADLAAAASRAGALALAGKVRRSEPLSAARAILTGLFGLEGTTGAARRERLREMLALAVGAEGMARAFAAFSLLLLDDPAAPRGSTPDLPPAWIAGLIRGRAAALGAGLVIVEDLERADGATAGLTLALADEARRGPLVVVATVRAGGDADRIAAALAARGALETIDLMPGPAATAGQSSAAIAMPDPLDGPARVLDAERRLALAGRLRALHDHAGATAELEEAIRVAGDAAPPSLGARLRRELARTLRLTGARLDEAADLGRVAAALSRQGGQPVAAAEALLERGLAQYLSRRYEDALRSFDAGVGEVPEAEVGGEGRRVLAELAHASGLALARLPGAEKAAEAHRSFQTALRAAASAGDLDLYARVAQSSGDAHLRAGDHAAAERYLQLSYGYKERLGDTAGLAIASGSLGRLAKARGDRDGAIAWFDRDLALAVRVGDTRGVGVAGNSLGDLHEERYHATGDRGALQAAEAAFAVAGDAARRSRNAIDEGISGLYHGRFLCRTGGEAGRKAGLAELEQALASFRRIGEPKLVQETEAAIAAARAAAAAPRQARP